MYNLCSKSNRRSNPIGLRPYSVLPIVIWLRQSLNNDYANIKDIIKYKRVPVFARICSVPDWLCFLYWTQTHTHIHKYTKKNYRLTPLRIYMHNTKKLADFLIFLRFIFTPPLSSPPKSWYFSAVLISFCLLPPPSLCFCITHYHIDLSLCSYYLTFNFCQYASSVS